MIEEIWKPVVGYEATYEVSDAGNVRNINRGKNLKIWKHRTGYMLCKLYLNGDGKTLAVHRLMAIAFIPNPLDKPQVNHKDTVKHNNFIDNLEWVNNSENQLHASAKGINKRASGADHPASKAVFQYSLNGVFIKEWATQSQAAKSLGIQQNGIFLSCNNKIKKSGGYVWKYK